MLEQEKLQNIEQLALEIAQQVGCQLYDLEFVGHGHGRTLRVFIDKDDQGVGIDDCVSVSKALNLKLDEQDLIEGGAYQLEVSSPGLDRQLKKLWHFVQAIGQKIYIQLNQPLKAFGVTDQRWVNCKKTEMILKIVEAEHLILALEGDIEVRIPRSAIEKAKMVFSLDKHSKK